MIEESLENDKKIEEWGWQLERRWLLMLIKAVKYATGEVTYRRKDYDRL